MQDAFGRDMFNVPNVNCSRYNGHIQVSNSAKGTGGKRDRKGCTKGKIEAIMKNNAIRPKVSVSVPSTKKSGSTSSSNHVVYTNKIYAHLKLSDQDDPYTFTESEPQSLSNYQGGVSLSASSSKKLTSLIHSPSMVCAEKVKVDPGRGIVKPQLPNRVVTAGLEGSSKMNKLQADIARNKVIGKRRKIDHTSNSVASSDWGGNTSKKDRGKICIAAKFVPRKSTWQKECKSRHELLQRILEAQSEVQEYTRDLYPLGLELSDSDDDSENSTAIYGRHWFSRSGLLERSLKNSGGEGTPRERRVEETRTELRRKLSQTLKGLASAELPSRDLLTAVIAAARKFPNATAAILNPTTVRTAQKPNRGARFLVTGEKCSYSEGCNWQSLPCTRHCSQHIMYNVDQRLFSHCTAKYSDNTQCSAPVFDVLHDLPLCAKHASTSSLHQGNNIKYGVDLKSGKKVSKKSRLLGGSSRSGKRSQKKRKKSSLSPHQLRLSDSDHISRPLDSPHLTGPVGSPTIQQQIMDTALTNNQNHIHFEEIEVAEEVLEIPSLDPASQELAHQASRLLEEHDITNMLNQISPDAFNDLFIGDYIDKNGEYEPTREETEELERALEAVDNDVRSLEQMTRSLPLLQLPLDPMSLLDEATATAAPPFHNGFPPPATAAVTDLHPS